MARFRGTLQGSRGEASRLGDSRSGLEVDACSWNGRIEVRLWAKYARNEKAPKGEEDIDYVRITSAQHGSSRNPTGTIFEGTFEEIGQAIMFWERRDELNAALALTKGAR
jgi:hypothetical protein